MAELADVELDAAALKNVAGGDCYAVDGCMEKGCNWYFYTQTDLRRRRGNLSGEE